MSQLLPILQCIIFVKQDCKIFKAFYAAQEYAFNPDLTISNNLDQSQSTSNQAFNLISKLAGSVQPHLRK